MVMSHTQIDRLADELVAVARQLYGDGPIPLHRPVFEGREKQYLAECIDSNFVSSVGAKVSEFERGIADFVGARFGVATVNGTAALHAALQLAGVMPGDLVITQALTFIATCNALSYTHADPVFVDVDRDTLGMSPEALESWLAAHSKRRDRGVVERSTGRRIAACVPMHTFGHPCRIERIVEIAREHGIPVVEDAAESLGSSVGARHTGTFGVMGTLSFNGNKIITTGGGGMIVTDDERIAARAKHLTTTAKRPHPYEFFHDETGFNYRLPNLNAALGCAQLERLRPMLEIKAEVAERYRRFCADRGVAFVDAPPGTISNFWLNAMLVDSREQRDEVLRRTNEQGVMTRPAWRLMHELPMFRHCMHDGLEHSRWLEERI
ncbi:MAG: LegC family aminotransferase, partial [Phycisphaerae bacterium]|nr:LegC family aminotransferase [Phycisphaerae bacterium]